MDAGQRVVQEVVVPVGVGQQCLQVGGQRRVGGADALQLFGARGRLQVEQGIEQGIEKGEALVLQRLLTKRFGTLPGELVVTISTAPAAQIDVWVDRVIDAASLEEVFRP